MAKKAKSVPAVNGAYALMGVDELRANPRNYNKCSSFVFAKLVESISTFGFTDPLIVRDTDDGVEVIGGHHRLLAAKNLGMVEVPVINVGAVDDNFANRLMVVLNETKGQADQDSLAALVQMIREEGGEDALQVLPFNDSQLADLLDDLAEAHIDTDDDDIPPQEDVKPSKIKPADVAAVLELAGTSQADLLRIITAIREWRTSKDARTPAWEHLLTAIERDTDA